MMHGYNVTQMVSKITLPGSVIILENGVFSGHKGISSINLSLALSTIGNQAFLGCFQLKSIDFPESLESIGDLAFSGCSGLSSLVVIPGCVKAVGSGCFVNCVALVSVIEFTQYFNVGD